MEGSEERDTAKIGCTDVMASLAWHIHKWVRKRLAFKHKRGGVRFSATLFHIYVMSKTDGYGSFNSSPFIRASDLFYSRFIDPFPQD